MTSELPAIAFDRFIRLDWIAEALKVRSGQIPPEQLEAFLDSAGLGQEARKKTRTKLKVLCLEPRSELKEFMDRGAKIALSASSPNALLTFAWGAVITNYPFFARVTELIGRLTSIQGSCTPSEVHRRMSEIYGERHNVRVATQAVIQSLVDWTVVTRSRPNYHLTPVNPVTLSDHERILWLIEAMVRQAGKPIPLENINSSPLGFPFYFDAPISYLVSDCDHLELRLEGASKQFVALRDRN
jgi:hypothetical protein